MTEGWRKRISRTSYRIGDDFSITVMRLSHRDYTDDAGDAIFNRKRVRENNSRRSDATQCLFKEITERIKWEMRIDVAPRD